MPLAHSDIRPQAAIVELDLSLNERVLRLSRMMPKYQLSQAEYSKLPSIRLSGGKFQITLINSVLKLQRLVFRLDKNVALTTHRLKLDDGEAKVLHFKPKTIAANRPSVVYFHGGGFMLSYGLGHLRKAQEYAINAKVNVFLVSYRLSAKHPFPVPFDDCYAAFNWINQHTKELDISNKVVLLGESAGGALAAVVAQKAIDDGLDIIQGQVLIYPVTDYECKTHTATSYSDTPVWNSGNNKIMWNLYLSNHLSREVPKYASPIHRESFSNLPPAYIELAEFDPLFDEGHAYAKALKGDDVEVQLRVIKGAIHGYDFAPSCAPIVESMQSRYAAISNMLDA